MISLKEYEEIKTIQDVLKYKEDQRAEFFRVYMYILSNGMNDGITESTEYKEMNEGVFTGIMNFFKGKKLVKKYFDGLLANAGEYVATSKKISKAADDNEDGKRDIAKLRKDALSAYEKKNKALDGIDKNIKELSKDSAMLSTLYKVRNVEYRIKLVTSGKKSGVSVAKLRGYADDVDALKKEKSSVDKQWDAMEDDVKEAREKEKKIQDSEVAKKAQEDIEKLGNKKGFLTGKLEGLDKDSDEYKKISDQIKSVDADISKNEKTIAKELGEEAPEEKEETEDPVEDEETTDDGKTDSETTDGGNDVEIDAETAKANAEANAYKIDVINKKLKGAQSSLKKVTDDMKKESDMDKKESLQKAINSINTEIDKKKKELEVLKSKSNESFLSISDYYTLSILESEIDTIIESINNL